MRVVYSYSCLYGETESDLHKYPSQLEAFRLSLLSWRKFEPTAKLYLYCDKPVRDLVYREKLNILLTGIQEVDFRREVGDLPFIAIPKIWAACQQTEPFFICDTDMIVLKKPEIPSKKYVSVFQLYNFVENFNFAEFSSLSVESFYKWQKMTGLDPSKCVNGGLLYFPDPEIAKEVYNYILDINRQSVKHPVPSQSLAWVFLEEVPLRNKLIELQEGKDLKLFPEGTFFEMTENSETFNIEWVKNRVFAKHPGFI